MSIKLYNVKNRTKEAFKPIDERNVRMYVCGPTVYDRAHIGNARPVVVFDILYRLLRHTYGINSVSYARNFTDVDDKINIKAISTGKSIREITNETINWYIEDMTALGALEPDYAPRATEYISEMIEMSSELIKKGHAYVAEGHVLFDVSSYEAYGELSGRSIDDMIAGARVEVAPYKRNPMDFVLWKPSNNDQPGWESPWGFGRPGWHIECSAMAEKTLSLPFDIHGGGLDLTFPHHENEIAQSCAAHDFKNPQEYAKYWIHNGFVTMDGEKMSKSLGNIFLVNDLLEQYPGETLRLSLLSSHYKQPLNWNTDIIEQAQKNLDRLYRVLKDNINIDIDKQAKPSEEVIKALSDDLNSSLAIYEINSLADNLSKCKSEEKSFFKGQLLACGKILGILQDCPNKWLKYGTTKNNIDSNLIEELLNKRKEARDNKNFTEADKVRDKLKEMGIEIEDTSDGTIWRSQN